MAIASEEIFIVDDDPVAREAMTFLFSQAGYRVASFLDGVSFVAAARMRMPAGVVLDLYMPGRSGLEILNDIDAHHFAAPIFVASARSDIPTAVESIRRGAFDFFEKGSAIGTLVGRMQDAIVACANERQNRTVTAGAPRDFPGHELLTPRESNVLGLITSGSSNQEAADKLGISRRTVEVHRARILAKLKAKNTADLVRLVFDTRR